MDKIISRLIGVLADDETIKSIRTKFDSSGSFFVYSDENSGVYVGDRIRFKNWNVSEGPVIPSADDLLTITDGERSYFEKHLAVQELAFSSNTGKSNDYHPLGSCILLNIMDYQLTDSIRSKVPSRSAAEALAPSVPGLVQLNALFENGRPNPVLVHGERRSQGSNIEMYIVNQINQIPGCDLDGVISMLVYRSEISPNASIVGDGIPENTNMLEVIDMLQNSFYRTYTGTFDLDRRMLHFNELS